MSKSKIIVFFPEAAFGPALNCVAIAQELKKLGHKPVFMCDNSFAGVFSEYGFDEYLINMSGDMSPEDVNSYWDDFIKDHLPHFRLSPLEQVSTYVAPVWDAVVDSAVNAQGDIEKQLGIIKPDLICVDNVILFPAIKKANCPWIRIISCSENEIPDIEVPPHLSGCSQGDTAGYQAFEEEFEQYIAPTHQRFNEFLAQQNHAPYPLGQFFEPSPVMNFLLYPKPLAFNRAQPLSESQFQYLEGCVRDDGNYDLPDFPTAYQDKPLIYISFGSLGDADIELYQRMLSSFANMPYRILMKVGEDMTPYNKPDNVHLQAWYPQPAVIPQVDLFIHHGGNNSFNEALYFGKPAIIMPYCWDGHDNAARIEDTGYGHRLARYDWSDSALEQAIDDCLNNQAMQAKLAKIKEHMQKAQGNEKAAQVIDSLLKKGYSHDDKN